MTSKNYGMNGIAGNVEFGKGGPRVKDASGAIEARNNSDGAYAILRCADPMCDDDATTSRVFEEKRHYQSAGIADMPSWHDNGDGTADIGSGTVRLYATALADGRLEEFTLDAAPGLAFTEGVTSYVIASYNGGSPAISVTTNVLDIDEATVVPIYTVFRMGTQLYVLPWNNLAYNLSTRIHYRLVKTNRFAHEYGVMLGEDSGRVVTVSEGRVFYGVDSLLLAPFRSDAHEMYLVYHSGGTWTRTPITQYNNSQYDDGTGLKNLNPNMYAVNWVYRGVDTANHCCILLGQGNYKLADAIASGPPLSLPPFIPSHNILVGRIIVMAGATEATKIDSAFQTAFQTGSVPHNDTTAKQGGSELLNEFYHLTTSELAAVQEIPIRQGEGGEYGFADNAETSISFDDNTYTFTLTDTGTGWTYYRDGARHTIFGNKTVVLAGSPPAAGVYFIYIDATDGTLTANTGSWSLNDTKVPVATIAWNGTNTPKYLLADERHTNKWPRGVHRYEHFTSGTQLVRGGVIGDVEVPVGSPSGNDDNAFSLTEAVVADEDLWHTIDALADGDGVANNYSLLYRTAASTWSWRRSPVPLAYTTTGYIEYDNAGTLTPSVNNRYVNVYVWLTNFAGDFRIVCIPGRAAFTTAAAAYAEDWRSFTYSGFPIKEGVLLYQLTFATGNAYSTLGKVKLARAPLRLAASFVTSTVSGVGTDHETLSNLLGGDASGHYHLTEAQHTELTGGGDTALHAHDGIYYTETEIGSTTSGSEGAALIGTDVKVNLGGATTVEAAITAADTHVGSTSNPHSVTAAQVGAVAVTIVNAKGDLIGASADNTPVRVPIAGGDNYILKSDSGATPGVSWQPPPTRTIWLSAGGAILPTTNPATRETQERAINKNAYEVLKFPYGGGAGVGNADWIIAMPDAWDGGTIAAKFYYYTMSTDGTSEIVWQIKGVCIADAENTDVAWGSAQVVASRVSGTANHLKVSTLASPITVGGSPAAGELLHMRVTRDAAHASDNTTLDAYLVGVRLEFTTSGWTD